MFRKNGIFKIQGNGEKYECFLDSKGNYNK